VSKNVTPSS